MAAIAPSSHPSIPEHAEPVWDLALLYPMQGTWSQEEYLELTDSTNWLIEYTAGRIEVLPMPTIAHRLIVRFLLDVLRAFVEPRKLGIVLFAPTRVYVDPEKYREPDIVFNFMEHHVQSGKRYYKTADLVMEVVSEEAEDRERDLVKKRLDYAQGGIPEYWIVDPLTRQITVLVLKGDTYIEHGVFGEAQEATSRLLDGFRVSVAEVFKAATV